MHQFFLMIIFGVNVRLTLNKFSLKGSGLKEGVTAKILPSSKNKELENSSVSVLYVQIWATPLSYLQKHEVTRRCLQRVGGWGSLCKSSQLLHQNHAAFI